jgi:transposase InsO family protein
MMNTITQLHEEKKIAIDALCDAALIPRATYYRHQKREQESAAPSNKKAPQNALNQAEKQAVLDLLHSERFVDKTPYDVFNTLIDEGHYHCSVRTMYRLLEEREESIPRRCQRSHRNAVKPELIATKVNDVWSWDITKLLGENRLEYYYLYVIIDIYSRYVVGWMIADHESAQLAQKFIQQTALKQGIQPQQLTLHADNGASMKSHSVAQLLDHLGITKTHNRPYTSDDNPFSESQFKTLKYCPEFPGRFTSLKAAEQFCQKFFRWYNKEHYHSGILWLTPESVHYGTYQDVLEKRHQTRMQAYLNNPIRFNKKAPKLQQLPAAVYINPPENILISALQNEVAVM